MEGDIPEETAVRRSDLSVVFNELPLFKDLDYEFLREIAQDSQWLSLPGGATLFSAGDPADALYVVLSGCLGVFSPAERRNRGLVGESRPAVQSGKWASFPAVRALLMSSRCATPSSRASPAS